MNHLKRYSIIYIAILFISVIFMAFYLMGKEELHFNWKTISGDEAVMEDAFILGDGQYSSGGSIIPDIFQLSVDGSQRVDQSSGMIFGRGYPDLPIERYIEQYPDFMRGKNHWSENFTEMENQLIYVDEEKLVGEDMEQNKLEVELLDKETEETHSFDFALETERNMYGVHSVTADNNQLYIQVFMEREQDDTAYDLGDETAILVIDMETQTLDDIKYPEQNVDSKEGAHASLDFQDSGLINGEMHYLYTSNEYKVNQQGSIIEDEDAPLTYELLLYNVEDDSFKTMELPGENGIEEELLRIYDNAVYSGMRGGENYMLTKFDANLEDQEVIFDESVLSGDMNLNQEESYPLTEIHDGYFYIVSPAFSELTVTDISVNVFDMETGDNVYQGIIQAGDSVNQYQYVNLNQLGFED
ncbi:hypothetical protein [Oceanobacillus timonensis]|uniref:hypothetical protein n=1 Tax=Oceanobacillus timonensis TaxID=1926285 RepID=UPI0009BA1431|nr:hypothetical protein [Oceanobacillus timonensis]